MAALWFEGELEVRMSNPERVVAVTERLRELLDEVPAPPVRAAELCFRGWAQAQREDARAGYLLIREGCEQAARLGLRAWASERLSYAAEALVRVSDWPAARKQLDEAMESANAIGEREYLPRLLLLEARIAEALGEGDRARQSMRKAVAEARAQEALWPELITLVAQCERRDAAANDFAALRKVVDRLTEGLDTTPVATARALLHARRKG